MDLKISRWTLDKALKDMNFDPATATRQEKRSLVCAQCHVTYVIPKDKEMKSVGVFFPWKGSKMGDISVENIIKILKSDPAYLEWKQNVTGFKLGFSRHPEFEVYSRNSTHWNANVACADCHMQYTRVGANKISNHNVGSPLWQGMVACQQCHAESADWLKARVLAIQDRTTSLLNRAGYANAVAAKLFEAVHKAQADGKNIDKGSVRPGQGPVSGGLLPAEFHRRRKFRGLPQPHGGRPYLRRLGGLCGKIQRLAAPGPGSGRGDAAGQRRTGPGQIPAKPGRQKT